jgi:hypothetical protein
LFAATLPRNHVRDGRAQRERGFLESEISQHADTRRLQQDAGALGDDTGQFFEYLDRVAIACEKHRGRESGDAAASDADAQWMVLDYGCSCSAVSSMLW